MTEPLQAVKTYPPASLDELVFKLNERYQPIFGHPELSDSTTRSCEDRLVYITEVYRALEKLIGRPLRVLDLGCAQGFFCFSVAKLGAIAHGVDMQACNIDLCEKIKSENPGLKVSFRTGSIENELVEIVNAKDFSYDLVLGLSVLHHIVHIVGHDNVKHMLGIFARISAAGIFELALAHEPTQRSASQLSNPRDLLESYAYVHEIAQIPTHLGDIKRPLYYASNRYWQAGAGAGVIDNWRDYSHELSKGAAQSTRRYFFSSGCIVKIFTLGHATMGSLNEEEFNNEVSVLTAPPAGFPVPRLYYSQRGVEEVCLVREFQPGDILVDRILSKAPYDAARCVRDVLDQLVYLEQAGLYHNDFRVWNILLTPEGQARIIDYGAIGNEKKDRGWPYNIYLSFLIVMHDIINAKISVPDPVRFPTFVPSQFPEPYDRLVKRLLLTPMAAWSFRLMQTLLNDNKANGPVAGAGEQPACMDVMNILSDACKLFQSWKNKKN